MGEQFVLYKDKSGGLGYHKLLGVKRLGKNDTVVILDGEHDIILHRLPDDIHNKLIIDAFKGSNLDITKYIFLYQAEFVSDYRDKYESE